VAVKANRTTEGRVMRYGRLRGKGPHKVDHSRPVEEIVKELKKNTPVSDYREQSLRINGLICAKCAREFDEKTRHLLTVHHKDGNHRNNPPDGSNWENLCAYCHDDEHSRGGLGDYLGKSRNGR
jgi:hypothetical protein